MALFDDLLSPGNAPLFGLAAGLAVIALIIAVFARARSRAFLDPERFKLAALVDKNDVSHNTRRFRFALDNEKQRLGLPLGQHISFRYEEADGTEVRRSYTPVSGDDVQGYVDFVIKVYPEGKMSQYLDKLQIGDRLQMRGPKGRLQYRANMKASIGMLAGGTGIAPMFQLMQGILNNPQDRTSLSLVFGNLTEADILLRPQLDRLCKENPDRLKVHYVLDTAPAGWDGSVGYITKELIQRHMPPPSPDVLVVHCGPPMMNVAMKSALSDLGYPKEMRFQF